MVAGVVAGAAVTGAFSSLGPLSTSLTGYAGVLLVNFAAAYLAGWRRGLFLPVALAAGMRHDRPVPAPTRRRPALVGSCPCCCCSRPSRRCSSPCVVATNGMWRCRRPWAAWPAPSCWRSRTGCSAPAPPRCCSRCSTASAMAVGSGLDNSPGRRPRCAAGGLRGLAAVLLLVGAGRHAALALILVAQGVVHAGLGLADRSGTADGGRRRGLAGRVAGRGRPARPRRLGRGRHRRARRRGVVLAARSGRAAARRGTELRNRTSWPSWAPGLLVAAVPSAILAVTTLTASGPPGCWLRPRR